MKNSILIICLFTSLHVFSQRNEFQIRVGAGYGMFDVKTDWNATIQGKEFKAEADERFTKIIPHTEFKYHFAKAHLALGLHFAAGLREVVSSTETAYNLARFGLGIEYNVIDKPDFRWFAGVQPTYRAVGIYNGVYIGEKPAYDLTTIWSGVNMAANTGILYYFKDSWLGIHANAGWEGGKLPLSFILFDDTEQNKENIDATVTTSGFNFNLGLVLRIRSKKSLGADSSAE